MSEPDALCTACRRIFEGRSKRFANINSFHHSNRVSLIEHSAKQGCILCQEIWDSFSPTEQEELRSFRNIPLLNVRMPFPNSGARIRRSLRGSKRFHFIMGEGWHFDEYVWSVAEGEDGITVTFIFGNDHEAGSWRTTSFELLKADSKFDCKLRVSCDRSLQYKPMSQKASHSGWAP